MLIQADARAIPLADGCVQCVVTSPPYFGLRDYGTANQIGLEPTPDAFVAELVGVFREVRRVLADDGVLWLNLGDSYSAAPVGSFNGGGFKDASARTGGRDLSGVAQSGRVDKVKASGLKPKDLLGIPWRVAFALQSDGWYLRSDIIWHKPNPMPESVTDRPTKSHEYLFLLAKSERYFYDAKAVSEQSAGRTDMGRMNFGARVNEGGAWKTERPDVKETRNRRSVWTVATTPYSGAHFATMPEKLVEPCILAGSRLGDRVLDPFMGSGTVGAVAERLGRRWVGLDLNPAYHQLAKKRTAQRGLVFTPLEVS